MNDAADSSESCSESLPGSCPGNLPENLLDGETRVQLREMFAVLARPVELRSFVRREVKDSERFLSRFTTQLCAEIATLSPRVIHVEYCVTSASSLDAAKYGVSLFPSVLVRARGSSLPLFRMSGAPLGEESRALVQAVLLLGTGKSGMDASLVGQLAALKEKRHVRVFSSPGCPYCPGQAINALKAAMERPELISAECVTADQFPELVLRYQVGSVPHTRFDKDHFMVGLMTEAAFVHELLRLAPQAEETRARKAQPEEEREEEAERVDLAILGGGPAGLSAAIYAARSGLKAVVLEQAAFGGQVVLTPMVENYLGFRSVPGGRLGEILAAHARQYVPLVHTQVRSVSGADGVFILRTPERLYRAKKLLFATGVEWKNLEVPGEERLRGRGVAHCASCDGYLFRKKKTVVVGGGNIALTDALHLKSLGVDVMIMHRRDAFKAEVALQDAVRREKIPVIWNSVAVEVLGTDKVEGLRIRDTHSAVERVLDVQGVFVAVGQKPRSELAAALGAELDLLGTIRVDDDMRTTIPGVYAAGDVCGGARQIATAVGEGAKAALSIFADMQKEQ